jgi:putative acetyltransferase
MEIVIQLENPDQPDVAAMLAASDAYMAALYPAESNHLLDIAALLSTDVKFLVARADGRLVGMGAIVLRRGYGEIKRMYVDLVLRGRKIGGRLLDALEHEGRRQGVLRLRLETGIRQAEAINLYRAAGYRDIGPFGSYKPDPLSLFMEKNLQS